MALTIAEMLNLGRGRAEYVLQIGSFPYCVHTSGLDWSSLSTVQKQTMFGTHSFAGPTYFANLVDHYPHLERPGSCTVSMKDGQAVLTGGDWTALIAAQPAPVSLNTLNCRTNIQGLEGIQAIASTANDSGIAWGILSESFGKADTTLNVMDDVGGNLSANITAAGGTPYLLWIGGECVAATAVAADGDEIDITVSAAYRGLFRSKHQGHYLDKLNTPIYVSSSPLNGAVGRPAWLWMILVDGDGAAVTDPVLIRCGKVGKIPQYDGSFWNVSVLPWWSWLDYEMELSDFAGELDKYVFSRAPATTDHPPHMQISESTDGGANWGAWEDVWLCAAGSSVTYDTFADFKDGVRDALNTASTNSWDYQVGPRGPYLNEGALNICRFRGPLPAICHWGSSLYSDNWDACHEAVDNLGFKGDPWNNTWWNYYARGVQTQTGANATPVDYIYQMYRTDATDYNEDDPAGWLKRWPPSVDNVTGNCILYVKDSESIAAIATGDMIEVGTEEFWMTGSFTSRTTLAKTKVGSISGKEITINVDSSDEYMGEEALIGKMAPGDFTSTKFTDGMYLYYRPTHMELDPWPVRMSVDFTTTKLSSLFKAIFGDTSEITVSERIQADHVPMGYDDGVFTSFIDWDTLDMIADELGYLGLEFAFRYSGKINLWKEFQNCLRFMGCTPTYEWDATNGHYMIRFRKVGTISTTIAQMSGRVLNERTIAENSRVSTNTDTDPLFNVINLKTNWNGVEEKWSREDTIRGCASSVTGGKSVDIDVAARFIHVDTEDAWAWEELIVHFGDILLRTMTPNPSQTITATIRDKFAFGVGVEALVTLDNVLNPYTGIPGLSSYPCMITSMAVDLDNCSVTYTYRVAPGIDNGWGPACIIPANGSTIIDADTIQVDDISDDSTGRNFSNVYPTLGWYDHWFFGNYTYSTTMSEPLAVAGLADKQIVLLERGTTSPTLITGLTAANVDSGTYAALAGVSKFFDIEGAHVGYDVTKSWAVFFAPRDTAGLNALQERWLYIADTSLQVQDSAATATTGDMWQ